MKLAKGNIFESECQTIAIPVNCVGVMGKGLALQFKQRRPNTFTLYQQLCREGKLRPGKPVIIKGNEKWVVLFPTKNDWRNPSQMQWIVDGLEFVKQSIERWGITSIAIPPLGAGLGGLNEGDVRRTVFHILKDVEGEYYAP